MVVEHAFDLALGRQRQQDLCVPGQLWLHKKTKQNKQAKNEFFLACVGVSLPWCMFVYHVYAPCLKSLEDASGPLEVELQMV